MCALNSTYSCPHEGVSLHISHIIMIIIISKRCTHSHWYNIHSDTRQSWRHSHMDYRPGEAASLAPVTVWGPSYSIISNGNIALGQNLKFVYINLYLHCSVYYYYSDSDTLPCHYIYNEIICGHSSQRAEIVSDTRTLKASPRSSPLHRFLSRKHRTIRSSSIAMKSNRT